MHNQADKLIREKIIFLLIIVLIAASLFLPYKIVETVGGAHTTILGNSVYVKPSTKHISGFQFPFSFFALLFTVLASMFMLFSKYKATKIIALVITTIHFLYLFLLYFAINFSLNLFSPKTVNKSGLGYTILLVLSILFIVLMILTFKKTYVKLSQKNGEEDLLDKF